MTGSVTFLVTHIEPAIPSMFFDHAIALGDFGVDLPFHVSRLDPFWHAMRPIAFSSAGIYSVPQAVKKLDSKPDVIGIISQRKLIAREAIGRASTGGLAMRDIDSTILGPINVEVARPAPGATFLVPQPINLPTGMVDQYAAVHVAADLFDYISLAAEHGVLERDDIKSFVQQRHFFPGGCEFGYFPANWILKTLQQLEELGRAFLMRYERRLRSYDKYQVRSLSFLSERLGSFLLTKELIRIHGSTIPRSTFGHMCVVVENGGYTQALAN